ncbi:MAG: beta-N-acetylhexosaminidase [Bradymonadaceae bacterium]|nr:beta-N-acetylhexosaminidase [Lujinxingiaceae bacterium]
MQEIREAVGQLLLVGFQGDGEAPPEAIRVALAEGSIGGVILFRRNVRDAEQVASLNEALHAAGATAVATPFVAVDQEGGRVVRLREPLTPVGPMRAVGQTRDQDLIARVSEVIATEIGALGFNLNFAPVLDVDTNPLNPVIGDRAFSSDPEEVARAAGAFLVGHLMSGVIPCGKHFPGHGDTLEDSHLGLPTLMLDEKRLHQVELHPFRRAVAAGFPMLMTAHIVLPVLDAFLPATLSAPIIGALLRGQMGFEGVVITDCLEMKAVAEHYTIEQMVELGLRAGVDIFLICHTEARWKRAFEHLCQLAQDNAEDRARIFESAARVRKLKADYLGTMPRPWTPSAKWREVLGSAQHRSVLARVGALEQPGVDPTEA